MNIDSFKYLLSEIFFIDLKEERGAFKKNVEYPVLIKDMRNIVKENKEDIDAKLFLKAMPIVLSLDNNFTHKSAYEDAIKTVKDFDKFLLHESLNEGNDIDIRLVYAYYLKENYDDVNYVYLYVSLLEEKYKEKAIDEAIEIFEKIYLDNNNAKYALYKLGYYYRYKKDYIRSKAYFEKYMKLEDELEKKEEVQGVLSLDYEEYKIELAEYFIGVKKFKEAYDILIENIDNAKDDRVFYYLSVVMTMTGNFKEALDYAIEASKDRQSAQYMDQLAISNYNSGNLDSAIAILEKQIKKEDYTPSTKEYLEKMIEQRDMMNK